jgi:cell division protein FtsN
MKFQRGGFVMGLIVGLMVGLAVALGVALYVTKVPVPFVNKVPQRTAEQDAIEAEKNKNWDPNAPLHGKNPARPNMNASGPAPSTATSPVPSTATGNAPAANPPVAIAAYPASAAAAKAPPVAKRDPADILADRPATPNAGANTAAAPSTRTGAEPFSFFVQVGAYARPEDADAQRAKLAMMGMAAKVTEREQAGRTVFRVRVGPFDQKGDADSAKEKLDAAGMESSLVRVQR